jgi:hypothetical protein
MVYDGTVIREFAAAAPAEWTASEQSLWEHFRRGAQLDLGDLDGGRNPSGASQWPVERIVGAHVLARLLLDPPPPVPGCVRNLRLRGARITGQLDLDGARVEHQIELVECYFDEPVKARGARTLHLSLAGSWLSELRLRNIDVDGELALQRLRTTRLVDLADASVARSVRLTDAVLASPRGPALMAERIRIGGALFCQGLRSSGEVRIPSAHVGGILNIASADLHSDRDSDLDGTALDGNGITVGGSLFADCRRDADRGLMTVGRVFLAGANIAGDLDFTGASLQLSPHGLAAGSRGLPAGDSGPDSDADTDPTAVLVAERATIGGNLEIDDGFMAGGVIRLANAVIKGNIRATRCTIDPAPPPIEQSDRFSILADGLELGGDMLCGGGYSATGEMLLRTAKIGGNLVLEGAKLSHPRRNAMNIDRATIQGNLSARLLAARGTIRMQNTSVGGSVILDGARLTEPYTPTASDPPGSDPRGADHGVTVRPSLDARSAHVGRDIQCQAHGDQPFFAAAGVRLRGAEIHKTASFRGAVLENGGGSYTLNLFGLQVTELVLTVGAPPRGLVELSQVRAAAVYDNAHLWACTGGVRLEDFEYSGITAAEDGGHAGTLAGTEQPEDHTGRPAMAVPLSSSGEPSARGRVRWLQAALKASSSQTATINWRDWRQWRQWREWRQWWFGRSRHHFGYTPQPYEQLAACYRSHGNDRDARYVLIARKRHHGKTHGIARRIAGKLLDLTVGYGYRTWLALFWLAGLWALGYFYMRHVAPLVIDSGLNGAQWSPALYTLDLLLPIISFEQEGVFAMHGADRWVASGLELAGWLLATAVVAGLSRALQRRD